MLFSDTATIAGNPKEVSAVDEARRKEIKNVLVSANAASRRAATSANFSQRNGRTGRTGVPLLPPLSAFQFLRNRRVAEAVLVEVNEIKPQPVFYLALAENV